MSEPEKPNGNTEYPICELSRYQKSDSSHYTCKKDELFESSGKFLSFFGKKTGAKNKEEVIKKYDLLRKKNKAKYDLGDFINIDFENKQWHITEKEDNEFGDEKQPDSLDSNEDMANKKKLYEFSDDSKYNYNACIRRLGPKIENATKAKLCSILTFAYVIDGDVIDRKSLRAIGFDDDALVKTANDMMHVWYNDAIVISEIYETLSQTGRLCFLPSVQFIFDDKMENVKTYFKPEQKGNDWYYAYPDFLVVRFYKKKIQKCKNPTMAIRVSFSREIDKNGHANMLIINRRIKEGQRFWEIEHFEPHGILFLNDENKSNAINDAVDSFIDKLFKDEKYTIIHPQQLCPLNLGMQTLLRHSTYNGSCEIFSLWYGLIRLMNPAATPTRINNEISSFLQQHKNPHVVMRQIVRTFTKLVTVDPEKRTVNGTPFNEITEVGGKLIRNIKSRRNNNKSKKKLLKRTRRNTRKKK